VLRVEDQALVHDDSLVLIRLLAPQHVEEVRPVGEVLPWLDELPPLLGPLPSAEDRGDLGHLVQGNAAVTGGGVANPVLNVAAQVGDDRLEEFHGMCRLREEADHLHDGRGERPAPPHALREMREFIDSGELPVEEQVGDLLEVRVLRKLLDAVAPVVELPLLAVYLADDALRSDNPFKTLGVGDFFAHREPPGMVSAILSLPFHNRTNPVSIIEGSPPRKTRGFSPRAGHERPDRNSEST
jgi:hypothetical protein